MQFRTDAKVKLDDVPERRIVGASVPLHLDPKRTLAVAASLHGPRRVARPGSGQRALCLGQAYGHFDHVR